MRQTSTNQVRYLKFSLITSSLIIPLLILLFPQSWFVSFLGNFICPGAVYFQKTQEPIIALTIDDSIDPETTPQILEVLKEHQVTATFFPVSDRVEANPEITQAIVDDGHELGNHLTKDEPSIKLKEKFTLDLKQAHQVLSEYGTVKWLRPGGGFCDGSMLEQAQDFGYKVALGSVWSYDTHLVSSKFAKWFILTNAKPGSIIVLHDGGKRGLNTAKTLETVLPKLKQKGYQFVTLSQMKPNLKTKFLH